MSFILDSKTNTDLISLSLSCNYVMIIQKYKASLPHHPSFLDRLGLKFEHKIIGKSHKHVVLYENVSRFHVVFNVTIFQLTDFTSFVNCKMDKARDKIKDSRVKPKQARSFFYFN